MNQNQYIVIHPCGSKYYYCDAGQSILHRDDGPAVECASGLKCWYQNGKLRRYDGPVIECPDGSKDWWYQNGKIKKPSFDVQKLINARDKLINALDVAINNLEATRSDFLKGDI